MEQVIDEFNNHLILYHEALEKINCSNAENENKDIAINALNILFFDMQNKLVLKQLKKNNRLEKATRLATKQRTINNITRRKRIRFIW